MSAVDQVPLFQPPFAADEPAPEPFQLDISGPIGSSYFEDGIDFEKVRKRLKAAGDVSQITAVINSPGGSVFEGFAIYAELDLHPAEVHVEIRGIAASIASVIAMAAAPGKIKIHKLGRIMMHEARAGVFGTKRDAAEISEMLASLDEGLVLAYSKHFTWDEARIGKALEDTTWLNAEQALKVGAVSEIVQGSDAVNRVDLSPLAGFEVPRDVRELYDASLETPQPPAASLAGELLDFFRNKTPAPPEARPSVDLLAAVNDRLTELRSTAS